jgi:hypothetical protein
MEQEPKPQEEQGSQEQQKSRRVRIEDDEKGMELPDNRGYKDGSRLTTVAFTLWCTSTGLIGVYINMARVVGVSDLSWRSLVHIFGAGAIPVFLISLFILGWKLFSFGMGLFKGSA